MDIMTLTKKLKALIARTDVPGERAIAEKKLQAIIDKYELDGSKLDDEEVQKYTFWFQGSWEQQLLYQLLYKVLGTLKIPMWKVKPAGAKMYARNRRLVACTAAQHAEIELLFRLYRDLFQEELKLFQRAFIQAHHIFSDNPIYDDGGAPDISSAELERMMRYARQMQKIDPTKLIEMDDDK